MALDDYIEPEVGVAVALTAAIMSPKVRGVLRRGAVYGIAGVLMAGDAVTALARGVKRGVTAETGSVAATAIEPALPVSSERVVESTDPGFAPEPELPKAAPKAKLSRAKVNSESGEDNHE